MTGVFDLKNAGGLAALEKGDTAIMLSIKWTSEEQFASVGPKHFKMWSHSGKTLTAKKGATKDLLVCSAVNDNDILVGVSTGDLQIWKGNSPGKILKYHT